MYPLISFVSEVKLVSGKPCACQSCGLSHLKLFEVGNVCVVECIVHAVFITNALLALCIFYFRRKKQK
jgi:hypothetical protein